MVDLRIGDALAVLAQLKAEGVKARTCVTSPPYWGLRDYGHAGQIGLEKTPELYVCKLVEVFRAVRDVLTDDGTLWVNLGDSYAGGKGQNARHDHNLEQRRAEGRTMQRRETTISNIELLPHDDMKMLRERGIKQKDLVGIPWRVAFALQADGWYLRSDIIWHKPNPMPESVRDRPTKSHEYIFLLAKSPKYYYDYFAVAEPSVRVGDTQTFGGGKARLGQANGGDPRNWHRTDENSQWGKDYTTGETRNRRSVWTVSTKPYKGAHFATFPPDLIEPCILAGSARGDIVLDPFNGAGTTGLVALKHGRRYYGIDVNPKYVDLTRGRLEGVQINI